MLGRLTRRSAIERRTNRVTSLVVVVVLSRGL